MPLLSRRAVTRVPAILAAVVGATMLLPLVAAPASAVPPGAATQLRWTSVPVASPPAGLAASLFSTGNISCVSQSDCVVAGYLENLEKVPSVYHATIWRWDGSRWAFQAPGVAASAALVGTACPTAHDCWAVGAEFVGPDLASPRALVEHSTGSSWSSATVPDPGGVGLNGVACVSASDCVAVGNRQTSATSAQAAAYRWDGASWSSVAVPDPPGSRWAVLDSVNCPGAGTCLALGAGDNSAKGSGYFFAEHLSGGHWAVSLLPDRLQFNMGNQTGLFGLSCPTAHNCLAVGSALGYTHGAAGADFAAGVAETWAGAGWKAVNVPATPQGGSYVLGDGSCLTAADCWVALSYPAIFGLAHPVPVAHWDGSKFAVTTLKPKGYLSALSCLPAGQGTWCVGLGESAVGTNSTGLLGGYFRA